MRRQQELVVHRIKSALLVSYRRHIELHPLNAVDRFVEFAEQIASRLFNYFLLDWTVQNFHTNTWTVCNIDT